MEARGQLSKTQIDALLRPIKPHRVFQAQGQAHVPAYDVVAHLTRLFGFGGWDKEVLALDLVSEDSVTTVIPNSVPPKERTGWTVTYRCLMRLTVRDAAGLVVKIVEEGACGSANNLPSRGDAHDFAMKNALSYAVKRCAKDLGDQFGLSLYNKGKTDRLVGMTLVDGGEGDPEDHAPEPQTLGNDEWDMGQ